MDPYDARRGDPDLRSGSGSLSLGHWVSWRLSHHICLSPRRFIGDEPLVSFCFDDAPTSAVTNGARMLEDHGARGTFYLATGLLGGATADFTMLDEDGVRNLHRNGHEIALHGHAHLAAHIHTRESFERDLMENRTRVAAICPGLTLDHFAYPYGAMSLTVKRALHRLTATSRGITAGLNGRCFDAHNLRAVELSERTITVQELHSYFEAARVSCAWLVFFSHDVSDRPSRFGCSLRLFSRALEGASACGLRIATVGEAFIQTRPLGSWLGKHIAR